MFNIFVSFCPFSLLSFPPFHSSTFRSIPTLSQAAGARRGARTPVRLAEASTEPVQCCQAVSSPTPQDCDATLLRNRVAGGPSHPPPSRAPEPRQTARGPALPLQRHTAGSSTELDSTRLDPTRTRTRTSLLAEPGPARPDQARPGQKPRAEANPLRSHGSL